MVGSNVYTNGNILEFLTSCICLVSLGLDTTDSTKSNLDVYREFFETPFIQATEVYYTTESEKFISENSVPDYMKKVFLLTCTLSKYGAFIDCFRLISAWAKKKIESNFTCMNQRISL